MTDPTRDHCVHVNEHLDSDGVYNTRLKLRCNYCGKEYYGGVVR